MASRCKCSQSGTQATYPPTDALCQLTPYSLIILFIPPSISSPPPSHIGKRAPYHPFSVLFRVFYHSLASVKLLY